MSPDEPSRPDPDVLLAQAKKQGRGRLKVYLGMAPGVGKTFEMLTVGKRRMEEGLDVVVGVVETHGRKDTEALTAGLDVLPRHPIEYRGRQLMEFDLDAALARKPKLLLVAPMSGHFATLLRGTIRTLLHHHQVYVTDWRNVRLPCEEFLVSVRHSPPARVVGGSRRAEFS